MNHCNALMRELGPIHNITLKAFAMALGDGTKCFLELFPNHILTLNKSIHLYLPENNKKVNGRWHQRNDVKMTKKGKGTKEAGAEETRRKGRNRIKCNWSTRFVCLCNFPSYGGSGAPNVPKILAFLNLG